MLSIKNLSFSYNDACILDNLSLSIEKGEVASLIGTSGSGKTTLFKLLTQILKPQVGSISIGENNSASYMTQRDLLLPWRTVIENITLPYELGKKPYNQQAVCDEAMALLKEVRLEGCANKYPEELSGGMRQRVSLARALMEKKPVLLLDEPFASLDIYTREQMHDLIRSIQSHHNTTILMVTHDFRDAISLSDHIFHLCEGKIKDHWKIDDTDRADASQMGKLYESLKQAMLIPK